MTFSYISFSELHTTTECDLIKIGTISILDTYYGRFVFCPFFISLTKITLADFLHEFKSSVNSFRINAFIKIRGEKRICQQIPI